MNRVTWYHAELDDGAPLVLLTFPDESVLIGDPRTLPPNLLPTLAAALTTGPLTADRIATLLAELLAGAEPGITRGSGNRDADLVQGDPSVGGQALSQ
ncbi:hypothetical protein F4556_003737 [Kitasatospora gansuensis]|uniref:Uncharacterized protein n=1 Tax=Kitasatospora gansuensis TaxID=258050 RepID=A0A7W7SDR1_9ACTN|nr:hypothetical protein [Kitasatospora gansuensis]MBB4948202.1 hypothetical protein [Kitasatospora gansuensis]